MEIVIMIIVGLITLLIGLWVKKGHNALKQACTACTSGVVSDLNKETRSRTDDDDGRRIISEEAYYYPVFEYSVGELKFTVVGTTGSSRPAFHVGQQVTVFYNPNQPEQYYVAEDKSGSRIAVIVTIMGAVITVLGIVAFFMLITQ